MAVAVQCGALWADRWQMSAAQALWRLPFCRGRCQERWIVPLLHIYWSSRSPIIWRVVTFDNIMQGEVRLMGANETVELCWGDWEGLDTVFYNINLANSCHTQMPLSHGWRALIVHHKLQPPTCTPHPTCIPCPSHLNSSNFVIVDINIKQEPRPLNLPIFTPHAKCSMRMAAGQKRKKEKKILLTVVFMCLWLNTEWFENGDVWQMN